MTQTTPPPPTEAEVKEMCESLGFVFACYDEGSAYAYDDHGRRDGDDPQEILIRPHTLARFLAQHRVVKAAKAYVSGSFGADSVVQFHDCSESAKTKLKEAVAALTSLASVEGGRG